MTINLGYPLMNINEVSFMYSLQGPLEKEMATLSRTLAWKIPQTEERDRLQSMGSQKVGHD